jgi:hypothetical protein
MRRGSAPLAAGHSHDVAHVDRLGVDGGVDATVLVRRIDVYVGDLDH